MKQFSPEYFEFHLRHAGDWHRAENVPAADPATYRALNHCWFVDKDYVYFEGSRLKHADPASFAALNEMFAKDKNKVYAKYGDAGCVEDRATFDALDDGFVTDSYKNPRYGGYARDSHAVYFAEFMNAGPMKVRNADPNTFVSLGQLYGKDSRAAYYAGKALAGATPQRFQVLDPHHVRDAQRVYYLGRPIAEANPDEFEVIAEYHGRDRRYVYDRGQIIPKADPATYELLDGIYVSRDRHRVFVLNEIQSHIDVGSFEFLGYDYFADKNGVYWQGKRIARADRSSFRPVGYGNAADSQNAYGQDKREKEQEGSTDVAAWEHGFKRRMYWAMPALVWKVVRFAAPLIFEALFRRRKETGASPAPERSADVLLLAQTLSMGDAEALEAVRLAVQDPEAFIATYQDQEEFADEPSYASILHGVEAPHELRAFRVLEEVYKTRGLLGVIDWRAEMHETINQIDPMVRRHAIRDFDWSFVDQLEQKGDGTELRNNNFLSLLRDRLRPLGLALAHINLLGDSYGFAVLRTEEFAKINGMLDPEAFAVSDDFGPDEAYARGKQLLGST